MDPGLKHTVSRPHLAGLAALAKRCLEGDPGDRPTAAEVALQLGGLGLDENVDLEASVGSVSTKDLLRREASRSPLRRTMTPMEKVPEVMSEVDLSGDDGSRALAGGRRNVPRAILSRLVGIVLVVVKYRQAVPLSWKLAPHGALYLLQLSSLKWHVVYQGRPMSAMMKAFRGGPLELLSTRE